MEIIFGKESFFTTEHDKTSSSCDWYCGHVCCDESECDDSMFGSCLMAL